MTTTVEEAIVDRIEEAEFCSRVKTFLETNCNRIGEDQEMVGAEDADVIARMKTFQGSLVEAGLAALAYPAEFGGAGLTKRHQELFDQASKGWHLPNSALSISHGMCLPMLNQFGTDEQKSRFMPDCISGATIWCQLFSEPGAGSDVAGLATRATRDGDQWILNGQKVWTSGAHYADYGLIVARTDPALPKHQGLSMFIVDMSDPAVEVRPLRQISGGTGFNEVFFTDTQIPADWLLGGLNQGWNLAVAMLMFERVSIGAGGGAMNANRAPGLIRLAQDLGRSEDPLIRQTLADLWIRERIRGFIGQRIRSAVQAGNVPGPEGSIAKLNGAVIARAIRDATMDLVGVTGQAWATDTDGGDRWAVGCLSASGISIAGGTDEVQRNIIGERVLGLPKEPDPYKGAAWETVPRN